MCKVARVGDRVGAHQRNGLTKIGSTPVGATLFSGSGALTAAAASAFSGGMPSARSDGVSIGSGCSHVVEGSSNVFIEGAPAAYVGSDADHRDGRVDEGSPNVFVNGKALARVGDAVSCGGVVISGASSVKSCGVGASSARAKPLLAHEFAPGSRALIDAVLASGGAASVLAGAPDRRRRGAATAQIGKTLGSRSLTTPTNDGPRPPARASASAIDGGGATRAAFAGSIVGRNQLHPLLGFSASRASLSLPADDSVNCDPMWKSPEERAQQRAADERERQRREDEQPQLVADEYGRGVIKTKKQLEAEGLLARMHRWSGQEFLDLVGNFAGVKGGGGKPTAANVRRYEPPPGPMPLRALPPRAPGGVGAGARGSVDPFAVRSSACTTCSPPAKANDERVPLYATRGNGDVYVKETISPDEGLFRWEAMDRPPEEVMTPHKSPWFAEQQQEAHGLKGPHDALYMFRADRWDEVHTDAVWGAPSDVGSFRGVTPRMLLQRFPDGKFLYDSGHFDGSALIFVRPRAAPTPPAATDAALSPNVRRGSVSREIIPENWMDDLSGGKPAESTSKAVETTPCTTCSSAPRSAEAITAGAGRTLSSLPPMPQQPTRDAMTPMQSEQHRAQRGKRKAPESVWQQLQQKYPDRLGHGGESLVRGGRKTVIKQRLRNPDWNVQDDPEDVAIFGSMKEPAKSVERVNQEADVYATEIGRLRAADPALARVIPETRWLGDRRVEMDRVRGLTYNDMSRRNLVTPEVSANITAQKEALLARVHQHMPPEGKRVDRGGNSYRVTPDFDETNLVLDRKGNILGVIDPVGVTQWEDD